MIIVLFGQPHSGKTTLAKQLPFDHHIDGDSMRHVFKNTNYTKEGRLQNLNRASDIATYLSYQGLNVVMSLVYPYKEARDYLNSLNSDVKWVFLKYEKEEVRGRENFHVADFEYPYLDENVLQLNTSKLSEKECIEKIKSYVSQS